VKLFPRGAVGRGSLAVAWEGQVDLDGEGGDQSFTMDVRYGEDLTQASPRMPPLHVAPTLLTIKLRRAGNILARPAARALARRDPGPPGIIPGAPAGALPALVATGAADPDWTAHASAPAADSRARRGCDPRDHHVQAPGPLPSHHGRPHRGAGATAGRAHHARAGRG
jgi:hypothetical protein